MPKASKALGLRAQEDTQAMTVTIQVYDFEAETVEDQDVFVLADIAEKLRDRVTLYGVKKLLMDRTSQVKENPKAKLAAMAEVMARLGEGEWTAERVGGGLGIVSVEVEALAELKGISIPDAQAALKAYSDEQRKKILASPKVQERAKAIKAKREGQEVEKLDDLLV